MVTDRDIKTAASDTFKSDAPSVFWLVATCGLVGGHQRFGATRCLHPQDGSGDGTGRSVRNVGDDGRVQGAASHRL